MFVAVAKAEDSVDDTLVGGSFSLSLLSLSLSVTFHLSPNSFG